MECLPGLLTGLDSDSLMVLKLSHQLGDFLGLGRKQNILIQMVGMKQATVSSLRDDETGHYS